MKTFTHAILFTILTLLSTHCMAEDLNDQLTDMLNEFLAGASSNDPEAHERFWADDLIYTSSSGERFTKADIMKSLDSPPQQGGTEPETLYTAEHIIIHPYGTMAVVAFQLVGTQNEETDGRSSPKVSNYLNTGTFLERNGVWQVVAWQATRMAEAPVEAE